METTYVIDRTKEKTYGIFTKSAPLPHFISVHAGEPAAEKFISWAGICDLPHVPMTVP